MKTHFLTHGTNILCYGTLEELINKMEIHKAKLEKKLLKIEKYIRGEKLFYINKEKELCLMEIINVDRYTKSM